MLRRVDRAADGGDVARHAGCRLVVDDEDPFDLVLLVLRQDLPDPVGWRALAPLDIDDVHAQAMPLGEIDPRSEEHTSELQSRLHLVCRLLLEKKKKKIKIIRSLDTPNSHSTLIR